MGEPLGSDAWAVRIQVKPFIRWTWLGAILMALGGLIAVLDKRYRRTSEKTVSTAASNSAEKAEVLA